MAREEARLREPPPVAEGRGRSGASSRWPASPSSNVRPPPRAGSAGSEGEARAGRRPAGRAGARALCASWRCAGSCGTRGSSAPSAPWPIAKADGSTGLTGSGLSRPRSTPSASTSPTAPIRWWWRCQAASRWLSTTRPRPAAPFRDASGQRLVPRHAAVRERRGTSSGRACCC